jgi:RND family efflux transporter MFP subunit
MSKVPRIFWRIALILLLGGMIALALRIEHDEEAEERERETVSSPRHVRNGKVELGETLAKNAGIETVPAQSATWVERVAVYGRVVPNPKSVVDVRAPFAGTVQSGEESGWPQLGRITRAGESLGILDIRVGPQERLDLEAKLKEARLRNQGAVEIEKVQRDRTDRLRSLTTSDIVSRREMADALVALSEAQTQLSTTKAALDLWTAALAQINDRHESVSRWRMPLISPADGEITQVLVLPGAAVEAGSPLVRIVNFKHLLVRLDVPPDLLDGPPPPLVRMMAGGRAGATPSVNIAREVDEAGLEGRLVGSAPQIDVTSQLASYWYEAIAASSVSQPWRPGLFVKALVTPPESKPRPATAVPVSAVLWHEGQPWVYVLAEPGQYIRRSVQLLGREGSDYMLGSGLQAGEVVVARQTQVLLSEEFRTEGETD